MPRTWNLLVRGLRKPLDLSGSVRMLPVEIGHAFVAIRCEDDAAGIRCPNRLYITARIKCKMCQRIALPFVDPDVILLAIADVDCEFPAIRCELRVAPVRWSSTQWCRLSIPVQPFDGHLDARGLPRRIYKRARGGYGKLRTAQAWCDWDSGYTFDGRNWLASHFKAIGIERRCKKCPIVDVDKMATWQVSGIVTAALYDFGRAGWQGLNNDVCLIHVLVRFARGSVKNRPGARQYVGPPVGFALCGLRYRFNFSTGRGDTVKASIRKGVGSEDNVVIIAPCCSPCGTRIAQRQGTASGHGSFLQLEV